MEFGKIQVLPLSDVDPTKKRVTICVRVARMWNYYNKERKLTHVDLVLIDQTGDKMYAEIGANHAQKLKEVIQEGHVYMIRDFLVQSAKNMYKAVDGKFMIKLTSWSKVQESNNVPATFPFYAYCLTPFDQLPKFIGQKENFLDAMGIITSISDLLHVQLLGQSSETEKRNLHLMDIDGKTIDVALRGSHATSFNAKELYKEGQSKPLIILLVGTLMKDYRGRDTISCGEASKYYINPPIPELQQYYDRLGQHVPGIRWMLAEEDQYQIAFQKFEPEKIDIETLLSVDPYDLLDKNMVCTVTIMKLHSQSWWFLACLKCHKTSYPVGNEFVCSDPKCPCVAASPRYKVCLIGNDTTGEAQFVFFTGVAEQLIGKKVDILQRVAARKPGTILAKIASLVSQKFTLNFSVTEKSLEFDDLAFQVNRIDMVHSKAKVFEFGALASDSKESTSIATSPSVSAITQTTLNMPANSATNETTQESNFLATDDEQHHGAAKTTLPASTELPNLPLLQTPPTITKKAAIPESVTGSGSKKHGEKRVLADGKKTIVAKKLFKEGA